MNYGRHYERGDRIVHAYSGDTGEVVEHAEDSFGAEYVRVRWDADDTETTVSPSSLEDEAEGQ